VPARNKWQREGYVILHVACSDSPVDGIHRGSMDSYEQFTGTGRWARGILETKHFRPAVVGDAYGFHVLHFAISLGIQRSGWFMPVGIYAEIDAAETCFAVLGKNGSISDLNRGFKRSPSLSSSNSFLGSVADLSAYRKYDSPMTHST